MLNGILGGLQLRLDLEAKARNILWERLHGEIKVRPGVLILAFHLLILLYVVIILLFAVIAKRGAYTQLTVRGSKLIDWYLSMAYPDPPNSATDEPFKRSPRVYTEFKSESENAPHSIVINSIIAKGVKLDYGAVVLNSNLSSEIHVGSHSFLNGVLYEYYNVAPTTETRDVIIPSNMVIQGFWVNSEALFSSANLTKRVIDASRDRQLPLKSVHGIMIWGINDDLCIPLEPDARDATFCEQKWSEFLKRTGIRADDLWPSSTVCNLNYFPL